MYFKNIFNFFLKKETKIGNQSCLCFANVLQMNTCLKTIIFGCKHKKRKLYIFLIFFLFLNIQINLIYMMKI